MEEAAPQPPVRRFTERMLENLDEPWTVEEEKALELIKSKEASAILQSYMVEQIMTDEPRCRLHPLGPAQAREQAEKSEIYARERAAGRKPAGAALLVDPMIALHEADRIAVENGPPDVYA